MFFPLLFYQGALATLPELQFVTAIKTDYWPVKLLGLQARSRYPGLAAPERRDYGPYVIDEIYKIQPQTFFLVQKFGRDELARPVPAPPYPLLKEGSASFIYGKAG
jgi:hypothetical protein